MIARFCFFQWFRIQAYYLHPVAWLLFEVYFVLIFSNWITLQMRALTEKKLHNYLFTAAPPP